MQYLKSHYGRALNILPNDNVNIPNPGDAGISSTTTNDAVAYELIDSTVTFTTNLTGAIIYRPGVGMATVVRIVGPHTLRLSEDLLNDSGAPYIIYNPGPTEPCSIYIPASAYGEIRVLTAGGDDITFNKVGDANASMILPVQVIRVFADGTSLDQLIALW